MKYKREKDKHELEIISALEIIKREECSGCSVKENMNNNKVRFSLWVQQQNQTAINMYQKKGFRYVNKSTISMLKLKK